MKVSSTNATVGFDRLTYLRAALRHLLFKADREPDKKKAFELYLSGARELSKKLRSNRGFTKAWSSVAFAAACCALLYGAARNWSKSYFYSYPDNYLRIVQNVDPCFPDGSCGKRFIIQSISSGVANPETEMHFSEPQHFEAGMTFSWIRYQDHGGTAVVDGWDVVRQEGRPILAPNCHPDYSDAPVAGHIKCIGGKALFQ